MSSAVFRLVRFLACWVSALCAVSSAGRADAAELVWRRFPLPVVIDGTAHKLDTLTATEPGDKRRPVALIAHGTPVDRNALRDTTPAAGMAKAEVFARNGYAAFIVMRRGYGESTGAFSETNGGCRDPDYVQAGRSTAADLRAALGAIAKRPDVDPDTMIVVGQSGGGLGALALAADPPPGLRAVVNFAGGRGKTADGLCRPDRLVEAMGTFGRSGRTPTVWIYAANDQFFPPAVHERMFAAYQAAGGRGRWAPAPAFGDDGHKLSSRRSGVPLWLEPVERFLKDNGLPVRPGAGRAVADALDAAPPFRLSDKGRASWVRYLDGGPDAAFAATPDGKHWGFAGGKRSVEEAQAKALELCRGPCAVVATQTLPGR